MNIHSTVASILFPPGSGLDDGVHLNAQEHLKADRSEQDVLYELLLKLGLDLCVPIETREIAREAAKNAKKHQNAEGSLRAFASSRVAKTNMAAILEQHGIADVRSL